MKHWWWIQLLINLWHGIPEQKATPVPPPIPQAPLEPELPPPITPSRMELWCEAIKIHEGWYKDSRSFRNHNEGNLRSSPFQIGTDGGYAVFPDNATGHKALKHQLTIAANGQSAVYHPSMTLYDFFKTYAPSSDNNDPKHYAEIVALHIGVPPTIKISELLS